MTALPLRGTLLTMSDGQQGAAKSFTLSGQTENYHDRIGDAMMTRCLWAGSDPLYVAYHDLEWGVPVHDDRLLFEFLVLEGAQAGLSWSTILKKRDAYRVAFDGFDPAIVAAYC